MNWAVKGSVHENVIFSQAASSLPSRAALEEQTWKGVTLGMVRSARSTGQTRVRAVMQAAIDEQTMVLRWPLNPSFRGVSATRQGGRGGRETRCRGARPRADQTWPPTPPCLARAGPNNRQSRAWAARPP